MKRAQPIVQQFPRLRMLWADYVWADVGLSGSSRQRRKARRRIERAGFSLNRMRRGQAWFALSDLLQ
jgi:hypothetical protein